MLYVSGLDDSEAKITWGQHAVVASGEQLAKGVNLATLFPKNPFKTAFDAVDSAVAAKQVFETQQIKKVFHGKLSKLFFIQINKRLYNHHKNKYPIFLHTNRLEIFHLSIFHHDIILLINFSEGLIMNSSDWFKISHN